MRAARNFLFDHRRWLAELLHAGIASLALAGSFLLRFEFALDAQYRAMLVFALGLLLPVKLLVFRFSGFRDLAWRYIGLADVKRLIFGNLAGAALSTIVLRLVVGTGYPRSIYVLDFVLCLSLMVGTRLLIRAALDTVPQRADPGNPKQVLIYGAGQAGITVLGEIRSNPSIPYRVAGFIDDDPQKRHLRIHGTRVRGQGDELASIAERERIDEVFLAMPSADGRAIARALEICHKAGVRARKIPAMSELIDGVLVDQLRDLRLEDLLGRKPVELDRHLIRARVSGRVVLVSGAGGSIGSELCRQIARYEPRALIGLDQAESALFEIEQELAEAVPSLRFHPEIGNIQNEQRLEELFAQHSPTAVYHAAAYKHVPLMEAHLFEAIENNVFGTWSLANAAVANGVEDFVLISSDKAVRPANVMGASKRVAELVCLSRRKSTSTRFRAVRFGNVLGSNGSVIPLFRKQIAAGGPVTITHPEMRRYFMTIPEAAELVLEASVMGDGGEIFVLDMGEPVRIADLARNLILLAGYRPEDEIRIEFTGIRPGEKLYEELSTIEENTVATQHARIRTGLGRQCPEREIAACIERLRGLCEARDARGVLLELKELVPEYNPSSFVLRQAFRASAVAV
jgi:FlaA1/EpsC-like NDP-sugar epimerase